MSKLLLVQFHFPSVESNDQVFDESSDLKCELKMNVLVYLSLILFSLYQLTNCKLQINKRISGAVAAATIEEFPHHVSVLRRKDGFIWPWENYNYFLVCGGSIVDQYWVLTGATCLREYDSSLNSDIMVGFSHDTLQHEDLTPWNYWKNDDYLKATGKAIYPLYDPKAPGMHDIAMLRLTDKIPFDKFGERVGVVQLPKNTIQAQNAFVTGFGRVSDTSTFSPTLRQLEVHLRDSKDCSAIYGSMSFDKHIHFCYGTDKPTSLCEGDWGGGLVTRNDSTSPWILVGVASLGMTEILSCEVPHKFVVYTRVDTKIGWIQNLFDE